MKASIALANLYGTPASDRRIKSRVELSPAAFSFTEFKDYSFYDPLLDEKKERQSETVDLGEQNTDADGKTEVDLQLDRFADATYSMRFFAEAFEGEGGRSITGQASALVSALPYVVGYKSDGDLNYINATTPRAVDLVARRFEAQQDRARQPDPERHRAGIRFGRHEEGQRQLRAMSRS